MNVRHSSSSQTSGYKKIDLAAAVSSTTTIPLVLINQYFALASVEVVSPSDYAASGTAYYEIEIVLHGGAALAQGDTTLGLSAGVLAEIPIVGAGVGPDGQSQLDLVLTKNGSAPNLPTQFRVICRWVLL